MASWITFDCFGTLVNWRAGFDSILAALAGDRTPALLSAYHRIEPLVQAEPPHRCYKDVLAVSLLRAANEVGAPMSAMQATTLSDSWERLPVFPDVEPMLADLRASGYKPSLVHFQRFADRVQPDAWIHVACSWRHDIAPAHELGITRIWLDRDKTGDDAHVASAYIQSAGEVAAAIEGLR